MNNHQSRTMVSYGNDNGSGVRARHGIDMSGLERHDRAVVAGYIVNGAAGLEYMDIYRTAKAFYMTNDSILRSMWNKKTELELVPSKRLAECIERGKHEPGMPPWGDLLQRQRDALEDIQSMCRSADIIEEQDGVRDQDTSKETPADKSAILEQAGE